MKNVLNSTAGLAAAFAVFAGPAMAQQTHVTAQDTSLLLTAIYAKMNETREQTKTLVLAKAHSDVQMAMLRTDALHAFRSNLNNRFVLAHLEP